MSNVSRIIDIVFVGTDEVSGTIDSVSGNMSDLGNRIEAIAEPLAGFADDILKVDAALMAVAAGGLVYAFAKSAEFEAATIELQKVIGDEIALLGDAQKAALDLSTTYGETSSAILLSTANFKQAGFTVEESLTLTKNAMDLVVAGSIDASTSSELLIATLKGFKEPASEAARLVDILNEVSNNYATDVEQLAIGMATLSPIADKMGFTFEETAGVLTPVIEVFRSGGEAAIALKTGLLKLIDDSKPVAEALASIGVSQKDANGELRSGKDILFDVATAFNTAEESDKLFLAQQLVGIHQAGRMVEVFNGLALSTEVTAVAMGAAGSAALEVAARLESAEVAVNRFQVGFENLGIIVGDQFRVATVEAIDGATEIELALQGIVSSGTFSPVFDALNEFSSSFGDYLRGIAGAMPEAFEEVDFDEFLDAFGSLGDEFKSFMSELDLTKPEDLAKAIQFVLDSMTSLIVVTKGMVEAFEPMVTATINMVKGFNALDDAEKESAGNILGLAKLVTEFGIKFAAFAMTIGQHAELIETVFKDIATTIGFAWDSMATSFDLALIIIAGSIRTLVEIFGLLPFTDWTENATEELSTFIDFLGADVVDRAEANSERLKYAFGDVVPGIEEMTGAMEEIPNEIDTKVDIDSEQATTKANDWSALLDDVTPPDKTTEIILATTDPTPADIKKEIEAIPSEKLLQIELQGEIDTELARIEANAGNMQTQFEWQAKLDIAAAQANADIMDSIFEGLATTISSTSESLNTLYGLWANADMFDKSDIEKYIKEEMEIKEEAHDLEMRLGEAQLKYMEKRTAKLNKGDALINISADGLEPALEMVMWQILEKIQIRATEAGSEFLLGI